MKKEIDYTNRVSDVVHNYGSCSTSIIHWSQAVVPLLASSVPYLKFHGLIIDSHCLGEKCGPNCRLLHSQKDNLQHSRNNGKIATQGLLQIKGHWMTFQQNNNIISEYSNAYSMKPTKNLCHKIQST